MCGMTNQRDWGKIDGVNAARLKRQYDIETLEKVAYAYERFDMHSKTGTPKNWEYLLENLGLADVRVSAYQGKLAWRMRVGEFGGLPRRAIPAVSAPAASSAPTVNLETNVQKPKEPEVYQPGLFDEVRR